MTVDEALFCLVDGFPMMFDAFMLSNGYTVSSIQSLGKSQKSHVGIFDLISLTEFKDELAHLSGAFLLSSD